MRAFLTHPITTAVLGAILGAVLGFSVAKVDQRQAESESAAQQLMLAKIQLADNYGRLQLCSPFARADLERFIQKSGRELRSQHQTYLDAVASDPDFSRVWGLRSSDTVRKRCNTEFISKHLPTIEAETRVILKQWPSPGDQKFPYVERLRQLKLYHEWIDAEGKNLVGEKDWSQLEEKLRGTPAEHVEVHKQVQQTTMDVGNLIDEHPIHDIAFKHGIWRIRAGRSIYYVDLLLDAAFKEQDGIFYLFQGTLADRNEPRGYLRALAVPGDIVKYETLTERSEEQIRKDREVLDRQLKR